VSGPVPYYRLPATSGSSGRDHHGIDLVASAPERGRRRWVLQPGPAGRHDSWRPDAYLAGGLLKDEHRRVFLYVGCQERYRLIGRIKHVTPHVYRRTFRSHAAA
jgi:hypothetical protein